jgi:hypothetical protein
MKKVTPKKVVKKTLKFTSGQISEIMYEGGITDKKGENDLFTTISKTVVDRDQEKNSVELDVVIKEIATGKYYKATLGKSPWWKQDQHNAEQPWVEVKPKKVTKTIFS